MRRKLLACCLVLSAAFAPLAARAQIESREGIALQDQIAELRAEVEQLRGQIGSGGGSNLGGYQQPTPIAPAPSGGGDTGGLGPQLLDRVQRLEDAVRELRGHIDEVDNARQQEFDQLSKRIDDLTFQMQNGGAAAGARPAAGVPPAAAGGSLGTLAENPAAPAAPPHRTPEMILQDGNAALARHDYATAQADAKQVLANPKSPRAGDAQYLLAQSLAGQKDWPAAAVAYDDSYNRSKTGTHAPESLLGLANALTAIDQKKAACETLAKLRAEFPAPRPGLPEQVARARHAAGCA